MTCEANMEALKPTSIKPMYPLDFISECGGSYVKLLTHFDDFRPEDLVDSTPYSVMFGPDKCGGGTSKGQVHLILRHQSPLTTEVMEKHLKPSPTPETDGIPHVYTLILKPDNTLQVRLKVVCV